MSLKKRINNYKRKKKKKKTENKLWGGRATSFWLPRDSLKVAETIPKGQNGVTP
jgi:hypothetical protein